MGWKLTANGSRLAPRPILQKVGVYCPVVSEIIILMQVIKVKGLAAESKAKKNTRRNRRIWVQLWWDDCPLV